MTLDIQPLQNALIRLGDGYARYRQDITDTQIRDGLIQRFEFTYELAHRMVRRFLTMIAPSPDEYRSMAFSDLIRSANRHGLLREDWPAWRRYRDMRARTSHTYNEAVAVDVVAGIPAFIDEARFLVDQLSQRLT